MNALVSYSQTPGLTIIMDILFFLWMLPTAWAVEGKTLLNCSLNVNGLNVRERRSAH